MANIEARPQNGDYEIAYGHHCLEAAKCLFGENYEIPLIVSDMEEKTMLKKMADENNDAYGTDAAVIQMIAPSFRAIPGQDYKNKGFTAESIASFWVGKNLLGRCA